MAFNRLAAMPLRLPQTMSSITGLQTSRLSPHFRVPSILSPRCIQSFRHLGLAKHSTTASSLRALYGLSRGSSTLLTRPDVGRALPPSAMLPPQSTSPTKLNLRSLLTSPRILYALPIIPPTLTILGYTLPISVAVILWTYGIIFVAWRLPNDRWQGFMWQHFMTSATHTHHRLYHTLVTHAFSHAAPWHLLFNSLAFLSLAPPLLAPVAALGGLPVMSQTEFVGFYLAAAVCSSLGSSFFDRVLARMGGMYASGFGLGASGVMFALFAVSATLNPGTEWFIFPIPWPVSAKTRRYVAPALDAAGLLWNSFNPGRATRLGHGAHLAGFLFGLAYVYWVTKPKVEKKRERRGQGWRR